MTKSLITFRVASIILAGFIVLYFIRDYQSRILVYRAGVAIDRKNWDVGSDLADRSLRLNSSMGYSWYYRGVSAGARGEYDKARSDLMKAADLMYNPSLARLTLSQILFAAGEYADAAALLERALSMNPYPGLNPARNWQILADISGKMGKGYAGLTALWTAAIVSDMSSGLLLPIAQQYRALDHNAPLFSDVLAQYFAWVYKPDAKLKAWIISHYDSQKRPDLVAAFLENLIQRKAAEPKDYLGLALSYNENRQPMKAREILGQVAAEYSGEPIYHYALGHAAEQLGDTETMRKEYTRYLQLAPNAADRAQIEAKIQSR